MRSRAAHTILIIALLAASQLFAEKRLPAVEFISAPVAEWRGDSLMLSYTASVNAAKRGELLFSLLPIYIIGTDTVEYPSVTFATRSGARFARRRAAIEGTEDEAGVTVVLRDGKAVCAYGESCLLPSAEGGRMYIKSMLSSCCDAFPIGETPVDVPPKFISPDTAPEPEPEPEPVAKSIEEVKTERDDYLDLFIKYPVSQSTVLRDFNGNASELQRLDDVLAPILQEPDKYSITKITVMGFASPEAPFKYNLDLSTRRAQSMCDYIRSQYPQLRTAQIDYEGKGEDWDGLLRYVRGSGMEAEDEVVRIIETVGVMDGREQKLMNLKEGRPYRYMLQNFFPALRRIGLKITYKIIDVSYVEK